MVGADGHRLVAVTPAGTQKWSVARPGRVHHPAWSTGDGFVVTWLERGSLWAVDGRGVGERLLRRGAASVTPAWRPRAGHELVYARAGGGLEAMDADTGLTLWRASAPPSRQLAWSRDGRRLAALSARALTVLDARGHVLRRIGLPGAARELALHPSGRRAAVVARHARARRAAGRPRAGRGSSSRATWPGSPGRVTAAVCCSRWRDADQWLLLGPGGRVRRALHGVSAELGAAGGFPRVAGWCCPG